MSTQTSPITAADHAALARVYIATWAAADREALGRLVTDDVDFAGPMSSAKGRDAFLDAVIPYAQQLDDVRVLHAVGDDEGAVVIYAMEAGPAGTIHVAEHMRFRGDLVAWTRLIFDTAKLR